MEKLRTRDILIIFVIAKIVSLVIAIFILGSDGDTGSIRILAHTASLVVFSCLLLLVTKETLSALLSNTRVRGRKWGRTLTWMILAVPIGIMVRFGSEGIYLLTVNAYDHQIAIGEFNELIANSRNTIGPTLWLLIAAALVGAIDEEFIYRRIFLWHFIRSYGVVAGIVIASFIFGAVHLNPVTMLAGTCLTCIYLACGRLWVVVIAHASGNVFHPVMYSLISKVTWDTYFMASILASIVLCVVMARFVVVVKRKMPLYSDANTGTDWKVASSDSGSKTD